MTFGLEWPLRMLGRLPWGRDTDTSVGTMHLLSRIKPPQREWNIFIDNLSLSRTLNLNQSSIGSTPGRLPKPSLLGHETPGPVWKIETEGRGWSQSGALWLRTHLRVAIRVNSLFSTGSRSREYKQMDYQSIMSRTSVGTYFLAEILQRWMWGWLHIKYFAFGTIPAQASKSIQ